MAGGGLAAGEGGFGTVAGGGLAGGGGKADGGGWAGGGGLREGGGGLVSELDGPLTGLPAKGKGRH